MMVFKLDQIARQRTLIAFNQEMKMILSGQMSYCCIMIKKKKKNQSGKILSFPGFRLSRSGMPNT